MLTKKVQGAGGAGGGGIELTYIASRSNVSTSNIVVLPNGTQVGDLVISFAGTIGRQYNPAGWQEIFFYDGTFEINYRFKVMSSTDIAVGQVQLASVTHDWSALQLHTFRPSSAITSTYVGVPTANRSYNGTAITVNPALSIKEPPHIIIGGNLYYNANYPDMIGTFWDGKISSTGTNGLIRVQFAYEIQEDYETSRTFTQTGTGNSAYDLMGGCYLSIE
jgi:hypothetical protein